MNSIQITLSRLPVTRKELEEYTTRFLDLKIELEQEIQAADEKIKGLLTTSEYARTMAEIVKDLQATTNAVLELNKELRNECRNYQKQVDELEARVRSLEHHAGLHTINDYHNAYYDLTSDGYYKYVSPDWTTYRYDSFARDKDNNEPSEPSETKPE